jgi:hypothetical protein
MASGNFDGEIKGAMAKSPKPKAKGKPFPPKRTALPDKDTPAQAKAEGDTPAEMARDKARGIVEGSPQDEALDAKSIGMPPDAHHVAAAAGIAHAILGNRGMR